MSTVFVSHRSADSGLAERLAVELRSRGHDTWLDNWKIDVGDSIVERIDEGLESSAYLLLCYSECAMESPWMNREWMATLARQLDGANVRVLPVRLSGGRPPAILADLKYADLTSNWQGGIEAICAALR